MARGLYVVSAGIINLIAISFCDSNDSHVPPVTGRNWGKASIMADRKLPDSYEEKPFIEGYLSVRLETGDLPEFGYKGNHLPATSGKVREIQSSVTIAQKRSNNEK